MILIILIWLLQSACFAQESTTEEPLAIEIQEESPDGDSEDDEEVSITEEVEIEEEDLEVKEEGKEPVVQGTTSSSHLEKKEEEKKETKPEAKQEAQSLKLSSCGRAMELFGVEPLDPKNYLSITPLGNLDAPSHTFPTVHTYLMLADKSVAAAVYAPGDLVITSLTQLTVEATGKTDYSISFSVCTEVTGYFDHVTTLAPAILKKVKNFANCQRYNPGDGMQRSCTEKVTIEVVEGELLGDAGGPKATGSAALDLGLRDSRTRPIDYVNKDRLVNADQLYVVCPYDYFEKGLVRRNLFDKLSKERNLEPICGTVALDLSGTAQGRWYLAGSAWSSSEADHLALAPSNRDPNVGVLSVGNSKVGTDEYHFDMLNQGNVRRKFSDITHDGNIYCFDSLRTRADPANASPTSGYLFLQMTSGTKLKLERRSSGNCPTDPNSLVFSQAVEFER